MLEDLSRQQYNDRIAAFRGTEYPMLRSATYLDHAGTTLASRSLIDAVSSEMLSTMLVNPHSSSAASLSTTQSIDDIRVRVLRYFDADPSYFDLVFVANATAAIKLVGEAFRDHPQGFWYGYHKDAHTSVIGVRELSSNGSHCFGSDAEVESWLQGDSNLNEPSQCPLLFAYPGQSNMNGRRLPLDWSERFRSYRSDAYSLLDAAALVSSSPLDLSEHDRSPDFVALSFYKIFGYPDLGALIVHKRASSIFHHRRFFGGGTVEVVSCVDEQWHVAKATQLHARLEDGSLPIRSIMALRPALDTHQYLYGSPSLVAKHTHFLAEILFDRMAALRHGNGLPVCVFYHSDTSTFRDTLIQGPIIAFNLRNSAGDYHSCYELNKLASVKDIHLRTGTLCNPGGVAAALELRAKDLRDSFDAGVRCGTGGDIRNGKPVAMVRISIGAFSTLKDVETFLRFIEDFFVQDGTVNLHRSLRPTSNPRYIVQAVTIYPIKSCAGWSVPAGQRWQLSIQGLAWDREWCLVHQGTKSPLNQKRCPAMAMMRPSLDLQTNSLQISYTGQAHGQVPSKIAIPLSWSSQDPDQDPIHYRYKPVAENQDIQVYEDSKVTEFFTTHLGVPCFLARSSRGEVPLARSPLNNGASSKAGYAESGPVYEGALVPGSFPTPPPSPPRTQRSLANESPILTISQTSLDHLNKHTSQSRDTQDTTSRHDLTSAIPRESFRANIVISPERLGSANPPFEEESWARMRFFERRTEFPRSDTDDENPEMSASAEMAVLGSCRRCQMICIDQNNGKRRPGPFTALAKLRQNDGGARFGIHCAPLVIPGNADQSSALVGVGDLVEGIVAA